MGRTCSAPFRLAALLVLLLVADAPSPSPSPSPAAGDDPDAGAGIACERESAIGSTAGSIISADALMPSDAGGSVDEARSREAPGHAALSVHALRMIGACTADGTRARVSAPAPTGERRPRRIRA